MAYTEEEQQNINAVQRALAEASTDFSKLAQVFSEEIKWTITGYGLIARTFHGMSDLLNSAEKALFDRIAGKLRVTSKGLWADGDKVFVHMASDGQAVDGQPYHNEYSYILTMQNGKAVSCSAWFDLHSYYGIIDRIKL